MALQVKTFKIRTVTAIVFAFIMLCGLFINIWSFLLLFTIVHFGCWFEFQKLAALISPAYTYISSFHKYSVMLAGFGFIVCMANNVFNIAAINTTSIALYCMLIILIALPLNEFLFSRHFSLKNLIISAIGLIYISLSCGLMLNLRTKGIIRGSMFSLDLGLIIPVLLIATIWINDTMAYIIGSLIGKTPLSSISPKKTWEGTIGGTLLAMIIVTVLGNVFFKAEVMQLAILASLICISGICGDLFESKLKRMAGVKDSGKIMPGHGGFLDRFDSLLFAILFVWLYVKLFLN